MTTNPDNRRSVTSSIAGTAQWIIPGDTSGIGSDPPPGNTKLWQLPAGVHALTSCRTGGFSKPPWSGLNLATHVGDDLVAVKRNRELLRGAAALPSEPAWLNQQHGNQVATASSSPEKAGIRGDACYTDQPNLVCAVLTADCLPILLCSVDGTELAAVHAGWRGLQAGIISRTLSLFSATGRELLAWIGPAISAQNYAVDAPLRNRFLSLDRRYESCFIPTTKVDDRHQWLMDLPAIATLQLEDQGLTHIVPSNICSFQDPRFYSHRRDGNSGRMATLIWRSVASAAD